MSTRQDAYDRMMDDRPSRETFTHAHVMGDCHINNMTSQRHLQQPGGDGVQNLIHTFKKFSFPSMDEYTRIELEQDRRRKSSTERPKSGSYPSEFHVQQHHSGAYTMDGGEVRRRKSREYLVADDDDEDNFMILSTRENRDNIVIRDEYNILNDDLKERRRSQNFDREEFPVTMVPICDIDYISGVPESADNTMWRQGSSVQDLRHVREFTQVEHTETRSHGNQTASAGATKERKSSKATTFMSKNEVRELLREFNEDYRRNTEILIKEMRESTSSLIRNFQETVTFSFREITASLKEMEEQNNRMNIRNNDVLSEDVELLYNKIMEDNQEIKSIVANLINSPVNNNIECDGCQRNDMERERRKSSSVLGPEEKIKDMEIRIDRSPDRKVDTVPVVLEQGKLPKEGRLDDYICEIVVCPNTRICAEHTEESGALLTKSVECDKALTSSVECAKGLTASVESAEVLTGSLECAAQALTGSAEYVQALTGSLESSRSLSASIECSQAMEAALNAKNVAESEAIVQQASCVKANICEVRKNLEELRRKSLGELVVVEQIVPATTCSSEDDWFKNLKTIHKSVHNGI